MSIKTVIQHLASIIDAYHRCDREGKTEWRDKHYFALNNIERFHLPSGSGINSGTEIDIDKSNDKKIVLNTAFHHVNNGGYYDGWTEHKIIIKPAFDGIEISISGSNRNEIKDYLHDVFNTDLLEEIDSEKLY